jgi:hypothetical protein
MGLVSDARDQLVRRNHLPACFVRVLRLGPKHRMVAERHGLGHGQQAKVKPMSLRSIPPLVSILVSPANFESIFWSAQRDGLALSVSLPWLSPVAERTCLG